jgi:serine protease AprX
MRRRISLAILGTILILAVPWALAVDGEAPTPMIVVLESQASVADLATVTVGVHDPVERRHAVIQRLREIAETSQAPVLERLALESRRGRAARVRPLWIANVITADLAPSVASALERLPGVARVVPEAATLVFPGEPSGLSRAADGAEASTSATTTCGLDLVRAPEVWNTYGLTGVGSVVAVLDVGTCWWNEDLYAQMWINPGEDLDGDREIFDADDMNGVDDDANGFIDDVMGWNFADDDPRECGLWDCDHGTHVAGIVAGDSPTGTRTGVAPDALVMALSVFGTESDVWAAIQYAVDNGADAISMSLTSVGSQARGTWRTTIDNAVAAGVPVVAGAGNGGSGAAPFNIHPPGDVPSSITVGSVDCSDVVAPDSSRGPVTWMLEPPFFDHPWPPGLTKPDVAGPGVDALSAIDCTAQGLMSGTSMATPHVSGAIALLRQADPTLTPSQIRQALESTAVDLGAPGMDNDSGWGRIDAFAAVSPFVPEIVLASSAVDESDPRYGDGDGTVEYDEVVTVRLTLQNRGAATATGVEAIVTPLEPFVEVLDGVLSFPDIAPGGTAESLGPHLTYAVASTCGRKARFRVDVRYNEGPDVALGVAVPSGQRVETLFFEDDMETDLGWTPSGPATDGAFVRQDPHGKTLGTDVSQPEDDTTPGAGTLAWITGNDPAALAEDDDVDSEAVLESPSFDASSSTGQLVVGMQRWFYHETTVAEDTSRLEIELSNDDGASYHPLETLDPSLGSFGLWRHRTLEPPVPASDMMRIRVRVVEEHPAPDDTVLETVIDDVRVFDFEYRCDPYVPPAVNPPNPVGNTLALSRSGDDLNLSWIAPPADGGHDLASFYRLYRSIAPDTGFGVFRRTTVPSHRAVDEMLDPASSSFYLVASENGGGLSGEEPAP